MKKKNITQSSDMSKRMKIGIEIFETIILSMLFFALLWFQGSDNASNFTIWLWVLSVGYIIVSSLELYMLADIKKDKRMTIMGIFFGLVIFTMLIFVILIQQGFNWFEKINHGMYILAIIVGVTLGKSVAEGFTLISLSSSDMTLSDIKRSEASVKAGQLISALKAKSDGKSVLSQAIRRNRYQLTFLFAFIGLLLTINGLFAEFEWYFQYLIPALMIAPLCIILYLDIKEFNKKGDDETSFIKYYGITQLIIEVVVGLVAYFILILVFVVYKKVPESWTEISDQNWVILISLIAIAVMVITHSLLDRDTIRALIIKNDKSPISKKDDFNRSFYDLSLREQLYLTQLIFILVFTFTGYYILKGFSDIIDNGATWQTLLSIGISICIFGITLSAIQFYYAEYLRKAKNQKLQDARKYLYIIGITYLLFILGSVIAYSLNNEIEIFNSIGLVMFIVIIVMSIEVLLVPPSDSQTKTRSDSRLNTNKFALAITILGLALLGVGLYYIIAQLDTLSLSQMIYVIVGLILGFLLSIYGAYTYRIQKSQTKKENDSNNSMKNIILFIIAPIILLSLGIVALVIFDFDLKSWKIIVALFSVILGCGSLLIGIKNILRNKSSREISKKSDSIVKLSDSYNEKTVKDVKVVKKGVVISKNKGSIKYTFDK